MQVSPTDLNQCHRTLSSIVRVGCLLSSSVSDRRCVNTDTADESEGDDDDGYDDDDEVDWQIIVNLATMVFMLSKLRLEDDALPSNGDELAFHFVNVDENLKPQENEKDGTGHGHPLAFASSTEDQRTGNEWDDATTVNSQNRTRTLDGGRMSAPLYQDRTDPQAMDDSEGEYLKLLSSSISILKVRRSILTELLVSFPLAIVSLPC